jgi:hypothetical protein
MGRLPKSQTPELGCRCKMRMSGLSKVEMSAFISMLHPDEKLGNVPSGTCEEIEPFR